MVREILNSFGSSLNLYLSHKLESIKFQSFSLQTEFRLRKNFVTDT